MSETQLLSGSLTRLWAAAAALLVFLLAVAVYAIHEHNVTKQLAAQNSAVTSALNATRNQVDALTSRLDALSAQQEAEKSAAAHPALYQRPLTAASGRRRIDDPRWNKMQGQLNEQAKLIDTTRQDLNSTRTQLQGSIATTHDELVLLEKKGERAYYEFDLDKKRQFQREGPVGVRLHKANTKHDYADLEMLVNDIKVSKNHVNILEPVIFYSGKSKTPVELVINGISKNHIHGYISEPKYKSQELEAKADSSTNNAGAGANSTPSDSPAKPSPARQPVEPVEPPKTN
jgi:hypothetical protein